MCNVGRLKQYLFIGVEIGTAMSKGVAAVEGAEDARVGDCAGPTSVVGAGGDVFAGGGRLVFGVTRVDVDALCRTW